MPGWPGLDQAGRVVLRITTIDKSSPSTSSLSKSRRQSRITSYDRIGNGIAALLLSGAAYWLFG